MFHARLPIAVCCLIFISTFGQTCLADPPELQPASLLKTWQRKLEDLGMWMDVHVADEWRVQKHMDGTRFQLLNDDSRFMCEGTREECEAALAKAIASGSVTPPKGEVVVMLHGLGKSNSDMQPLRAYLTEHSELTPVTFNYASMKVSLDDHALALGEVIGNLKDATKVHFVAHSMGNLVVRRLLKMIETDDFPELKGRMGKIVMLAPPNQGARLARVFQDNPAFKIVGVSAEQLTHTKWEETEKLLATPTDEFGIIAGASGSHGNPLIPGKDDWVVGVEETKLPGAADFWLTKMDHGMILRADSIKHGVLRFLNHGYFLSESERHPLK